MTDTGETNAPMKEWEGKIEELRERTKNILTPSYASDENLYRWVKGYTGNMDKIMPKLLEHAENRRIMGMDNFSHDNERHNDNNNDNSNKSSSNNNSKMSTNNSDGENEPIFGSYHPSDPNFPCVEFMTHFIAGFKMPQLDVNFRDKDQNLLLFFSPKDMDMGAIAKHYRTSDYMWANLVMGEMAQRLIRQVEAELNTDVVGSCNRRTVGLTIVEDLAGLNFMKMFKDFGRVGGNAAMALSQDNFPEQAARMILIRPPSFVTWLWGWIKSLFNEVTQAKFQFLNEAHWRAEVEKIVDPSLIPEDFASHKVNHRSSLSHRRDSVDSDEVPGEIIWPSHLDLRKSIPHPSDSNLHTTSVKPHHDASFSFVLSSLKEHSILKWYFETNSPVKFSLGRKDPLPNADWQGIVPTYELSTYLIPEWGQVNLMSKHNNPSQSRDATFRITFRNESTKFFALKIKFWAALETENNVDCAEHFYSGGKKAKWLTVN